MLIKFVFQNLVEIESLLQLVIGDLRLLFNFFKEILIFIRNARLSGLS